MLLGTCLWASGKLWEKQLELQKGKGIVHTEENSSAGTHRTAGKPGAPSQGRDGEPARWLSLMESYHAALLE